MTQFIKFLEHTENTQSRQENEKLSVELTTGAGFYILGRIWYLGLVTPSQVASTAQQTWKRRQKMKQRKLLNRSRPPYQNVISKLGISFSSFIDSSTNMDKAPDCSVKKQTIPTRAYFKWFQDFWAEGWTQQCLSRNILEEMTWRWY